MKNLKKNASHMFGCLFEAIVGILLLVNPVAFTRGIIVACGIVLMILGLGNIIQYFRMNPEEAAKNQGLLKGLIQVAIGAFCTFKSYWFTVTFPVISVIYGVVVLAAAFGKIQWCTDMYRLKREKWTLAALSAVISIICAVIILNNPFTSAEILWMFTGISLLVEAVLDLVILFMSGRGKGEKKDGKESGSAFSGGKR